MTKEDFEQLKSTVKQWLFHTGALDPTNYANELKSKFIEPREKRIEELEMTVGTLRTFSNEQATCIEKLEAQIEKMKNWCNCKNYWFCLEECCRKNISFEKGICYNCKKWEIKENGNG